MHEGHHVSVYGSEGLNHDEVIRNEDAELSRGRASNVIIEGWADNVRQQIDAGNFVEEAAVLELRRVVNTALEQARGSHRKVPGDPTADEFVRALAIEMLADLSLETIPNDRAADDRIKQEVRNILGNAAYGTSEKAAA